MNLSVIEYRGDVVDKHHYVDALIVGRDSRPIAIWGDAEKLVVPRSCIKPFHACSIVALYNSLDLKISNDRLALTTASHGGTERQVDILRKWLVDINIPEETLECGIHPPTNPIIRRKLLAEGSIISEIYHNSVGKHIALIQLCQAMGFKITGYNDVKHPVQQRLHDMFNQIYHQILGSSNNFGRCRDGSAIPLLTLHDLANLTMSFLPEYRPLDFNTQISRVLNVLTSDPALLSRSEDYFLTRIVNAFAGSLCAKEGSNGVCFFLHIPTGITGVFKVRDGAENVVGVILIQLLHRLNLVNEAITNSLVDISMPTEKSTTGTSLGHTVVIFD